MSVILGIDPGLRATGWGVISYHQGAMKYLASGTIKPPVKAPMPQRLHHLSDALAQLIQAYQPAEIALEEVFVSVNGQSTLKLGQARGAIILTLAQQGHSVHEYAPRLVKKAIAATGSAGKEQIQQMVRYLLPHSQADSPDAADALAIAICHAHHMNNPVLTPATV